MLLHTGLHPSFCYDYSTTEKTHNVIFSLFYGVFFLALVALIALHSSFRMTLTFKCFRILRFSSFQGCPKRNQWIRVRWGVLCVANLRNLANLRHVSLIACFGSFLRPSVFMASCSAQGPPGSAFLSLQWSPVLSWASRLKHRTFSSPFTPPRASPPEFFGPVRTAGLSPLGLLTRHRLRSTPGTLGRSNLGSNL